MAPAESDYENELGKAARSDNLDTVRRLSGRTGDPSRVNLWYAEVWSIIDYLVESHGQAKLAEMLGAFAKGAHPDDALLEVYGFDRDGLTALWWESLGAEVPAALQDKAGTNAQEEGTSPDNDRSQSESTEPEPTKVPAESNEAAPDEAPPAQPSGALACCAGLLPLGLVLLSRFGRSKLSPS